MREVTRDSKWDNNEQSVVNHEAPLDPQVEILDTLKDIREALLVLVSLNMRNYDLLNVIASAANEGNADAVYDNHEKGGHFNPPMYIPSLKSGDEE